jgi:multicomponent Na+:H+ antiporter subunit G
MAGWIADVAVVLGLLVMTIGVFGVYRMPDIYTRLHAAGKAVFLGVVAFVVASSMTGDGAIIARGLLIAVFLVITTPVGAHVIARAAHAHDTDPTEDRPVWQVEGDGESSARRRSP